MNKNHCIESLKDLTTHCYVATVDLETIQYAIKNIEAWEKVKIEIAEKEKEPNYQHEGEDWLNGLIIAEEIIDKHLQEVEQCQMQ